LANLGVRREIAPVCVHTEGRIIVSNDHDSNVGQTYLALRLGMVLLVALLFLAVAIQWISVGCLQRSISAYYFTSTRSVFVGALCAIGACLIVYRGNTDTENVLLDFSGFVAFVVAFVPTQVDTMCQPSNVPSVEELASGVRNSVWALLVIGATAVFVGWRLLKRQGSRTGLSKYGKLSLAAAATSLFAGVLFFAFWPATFQRIGHNVSAIVLFAGIVAVVTLNALGFARKQGQATVAKVATNRYAIVAWSMVLSAVGLGIVGFTVEGFAHWLFCLEAALILEFAVFWGIQTVELGGKATRSASPSSQS